MDFQDPATQVPPQSLKKLFFGFVSPIGSPPARHRLAIELTASFAILQLAKPQVLILILFFLSKTLIFCGKKLSFFLILLLFFRNLATL